MGCPLHVCQPKKALLIFLETSFECFFKGGFAVRFCCVIVATKLHLIWDAIKNEWHPKAHRAFYDNLELRRLRIVKCEWGLSALCRSGQMIIQLYNFGKHLRERNSLIQIYLWNICITQINKKIHLNKIMLKKDTCPYNSTRIKKENNNVKT